MTAKLSPREVEALRWVAKGFTDAGIAAEMGVAATTVRSHLCRIRRKLGFAVRPHRGVYATGDKADRVRLALYALQQGLIALDEIPVIQGEITNGK
jgi:DNA-binding NarL/FixJ family response regulator